MFFTTLASTLTFNLSVYHMTVVGIQLRNSLVEAVYRKTLRLSNGSKQRFTSGEITNFVAVDSQLLLDCVPYTPHLWADPLLVLLTIVFLYLELGASALAGVAFLMLMVPLNSWGNKKLAGCESVLLVIDPNFR